MDICGGRLQRPKHQRLVGALVAVAVWTAPFGVAQAAGADANTPAQSAPDASAEAATTDAGQHDDSAGGVEVVRYAGSDPYELSMQIARALVDARDGASEWVVLASGESWADAATAGPLAASLGAPVLLVPPDGLQTPTARPDLARFLRSTGVRRVVIVGSADVLPNHEPSVLFGLGMLPRNIERIHGKDPIGASIAIAQRLDAPAELGDLGRTVIVASGQSIADAVAVGPLAAAGPFPLLLTAPDELDPRITAYLAEHEITHVVLVGGASAIAPDVQEAIETSGVTVTRLAGRDRSHTARLAAELYERHTANNPACAAGPIRIGLAPAQHPEQALTAGPLLAAQCTPLRYAEPERLPADLRNTLHLGRDLAPGFLVTALGADDYLSDGVLDIDTPPVVFAAFNFRLNADGHSLDGILQIIDDSGRKRFFPETRLTRHIQDEFPLPPDWRNQLYPEQHFVIDYSTSVRWSHDGKWLAYRGMDGESLFVLNVRNGGLSRINPNGHRVVAEAIGFAFHWSPVANKLAFSAVVEDKSTLSDPDLTAGSVSEFTSELFVHDAESGETTRLTYNNFRDIAGPWSPEGSHLAFAQTPAHAKWTGRHTDVAYRRLKIIELATRDSITLHDGYVFSAAGGGFAGGGFETIALWSPDSSRLAFAAIPGGDRFTSSPQLYVASLDGSEPIAYANPDCADCAKHPTYTPRPYIRVHGWSPLGDGVAYSFRFLGTELLLVQDIGGGDATELLRHRPYSTDLRGVEAHAHYIGWTADGQALLYFSSLCRYFDGYSTAEMEVLQVSRDSSRTSVVLAVPSRIGDRHASCWQVNLLAPNGQSIALRGDQLRMRIARLSDGDWKRLLIPTQLTPESFFDTYNCSMNWVSTGIQIGCAHTIGDY